MALLPTSGKWSAVNQELAVKSGKESWEQWVGEVEKEVGFTICGALRKGLPCARKEGWGVRGKTSGRCKYHGGSSPIADNHPQWKTGARSRYMNKLSGETAAAFSEYVRDPNILGLQHEIALVRTNIEGLLSEWPTDVASASELKALADVSIRAINERDIPAIGESLKRLSEELEPFAKAPALSRAIDRKIDLVRKLVDTNLKRERTEFEQVSAARLGLWTAFMQNLILEFVPSPEDRELVVLKINSWLG